MCQISSQQNRIWTRAALLVPSIHMAAGLPWIWVVLICGLAGILRKGVKTCAYPLFSQLVCLISLGNALRILSACWPEQENIGWILGILLLLSGLLAYGGREKTAEAGILLWWLVAFLLGSVLLSAITQMETERVKEAGSFSFYKALSLLEVLLLPIFINGEEDEKPGAELWIPILISISTQGILGEAAFREPAPFYSVSRSVRLYGMFSRMEGMAWMGLMLGSFLYLSYLMSGVYGKRAHDKIAGILPIAGAAVLYFAPISLNGAGLAGTLMAAVSRLAGNKKAAEKKEKEK